MGENSQENKVLFNQNFINAFIYYYKNVKSILLNYTKIIYALLFMKCFIIYPRILLPKNPTYTMDRLNVTS